MHLWEVRRLVCCWTRCRGRYSRPGQSDSALCYSDSPLPQPPAPILLKIAAAKQSMLLGFPQVFLGWLSGFHITRFSYAPWKLIDLNTGCVEIPTEPVSSSESWSRGWGPLLFSNLGFLDLLRWVLRKQVPLCCLGTLLEGWSGNKERRL